MVYTRKTAKLDSPQELTAKSCTENLMEKIVNNRKDEKCCSKTIKDEQSLELKIKAGTSLNEKKKRTFSKTNISLNENESSESLNKKKTKIFQSSINNETSIESTNSMNEKILSKSVAIIAREHHSIIEAVKKVNSALKIIIDRFSL